jgi:hypothetical protein
MLPDMFPLGPFLVEASGRLLFRNPEVTSGFSFAWRGRRFAAVLGEGRMGLSGVLGCVPSSAAGVERRAASFAAVRALPRCLPPGWRLLLLPDHRVQVQAEETMDWPANAAAVLQPVVRFLLALAPYLDLLEESGLAVARV